LSPHEAPDSTIARAWANFEMGFVPRPFSQIVTVELEQVEGTTISVDLPFRVLLVREVARAVGVGRHDLAVDGGGAPS
jgi:hypothetical protein